MTKKMIVFATALSSLFFAGCNQNPISVSSVEQNEKASVEWRGQQVPEKYHLRIISNAEIYNAPGYYICKFTNNNGNCYWQNIGGGSPYGGATQIAVAPDGVTWVIDAKEKGIQRYVNNDWQRLPGTANDIAIGGDGKVFIIGTNPRTGGYGIFKWDETSYNWIQTSRGAGIKIAVDKTGNPWVITSGNDVFKTADGGRSWTIIPNLKAREICIKEYYMNRTWCDQKMVVTTTPQNNGFSVAISGTNSDTFYPLSTPADFSPMKVAMAPNSVVFLINATNDIWFSTTSNPTGWAVLPTEWYGAREVSCGGLYE